jgi:predicted DNA-binding protein YlxM (UPF0122 family)
MAKYFTVKESIDIIKNQIAYHELDRDEPKPQNQASLPKNHELIKALKETLKEFENKHHLHQKLEMARDEADKLVNDIEKQLIESFEANKLSEKLRDFRLMNIIMARNLISTMTEDQYVTLSDLDLPLVKTGGLRVAPDVEVAAH